MTTSRIVRGTKGRVLIYICAILFVTGLLACYNNVRVQLEDARNSFKACQQDLENLTTQLQGMYEYKDRLEKSLKAEQVDHSRTKNEFQDKFKDELAKHEKIGTDAKLQFSSLQQHYNLLQTQHNDFKEECSKIQHGQLEEINHLQSKLKEVQEELKRVQNEKENTIKHLKTQNELLQNDLSRMKSVSPARITETSSTHFAKQQLLPDAHYIFPDINKSNVKDDDIKNVLAIPKQIDNSIKSSTATNDIHQRDGDLNVVLPLKLPTVTPESVKKTTSKEVKSNQGDVLPLPYVVQKMVPKGVVPVHSNLYEEVKLEEEERDKNLKHENDKKSNNKHEMFNEAVRDDDNGAQEEMNIPKVVVPKVLKQDEEVENKEDQDYDGGHLLDEPEDDDLGDGNHLEPLAIRN